MAKQYDVVLDVQSIQEDGGRVPVYDQPTPESIQLAKDAQRREREEVFRRTGLRVTDDGVGVPGFLAPGSQDANHPGKGPGFQDCCNSEAAAVVIAR